jgi:hypothetical protein
MIAQSKSLCSSAALSCDVGDSLAFLLPLFRVFFCLARMRHAESKTCCRSETYDIASSKLVELASLEAEQMACLYKSARPARVSELNTAVAFLHNTSLLSILFPF